MRLHPGRNVIIQRTSTNMHIIRGSKCCEEVERQVDEVIEIHW